MVGADDGAGPDLQALTKPFRPFDVEWRVGRAGKRGEKVWAKVLAYITNRAIMERLDAVVGPENWKNDYREGPGGGVLCGIAIRIDGDWVWKWDGAENTEIESVKGGLSGSMKRAAVQWGIGRYLYNLPEGWAKVHENGQNYGRLPQDKGGDVFYWDPPDLPTWALPDDIRKASEGRQEKEDPEKDDEDPPSLRDEVEALLDKAAEGGHVSVEESAKVQVAISNMATPAADLEATKRTLEAWIRKKRDPAKAKPKREKVTT